MKKTTNKEMQSCTELQNEILRQAMLNHVKKTKDLKKPEYSKFNTIELNKLTIIDLVGEEEASSVLSLEQHFIQRIKSGEMKEYTRIGLMVSYAGRMIDYDNDRTLLTKLEEVYPSFFIGEE